MTLTDYKSGLWEVTGLEDSYKYWHV